MSRLALIALVLAMGLARPARADTWQLEHNVRAGSMPWSVTVSPDGASLWVAMVGYKDRDNVWRYDAKTLRVTAKSSYRGHAVETILLAGGQRLLVSNSRRDELIELDADTLEVKRRLPGGKVPKDFAISADHKTVYLANWSGHSLTIVDRGSGQSTRIRTGRHARGIALAPDQSEAYVTSFGARTLAVVDLATQTVVARIRTCKQPRHAVVHGDLLLVSCFGARHILVIDRKTRQIARKVRVGDGPKTIALAPDARFAVTANERDNSVSFVDLADWTVQTMALPERKPCGVAVSPDSARVYVTARGSHRLLVLARQNL